MKKERKKKRKIYYTYSQSSTLSIFSSIRWYTFCFSLLRTTSFSFGCLSCLNKYNPFLVFLPVLSLTLPPLCLRLVVKDITRARVRRQRPNEIEIFNLPRNIWVYFSLLDDEDRGQSAPRDFSFLLLTINLNKKYSSSTPLPFGTAPNKLVLVPHTCRNDRATHTCRYEEGCVGGIGLPFSFPRLLKHRTQKWTDIFTFALSVLGHALLWLYSSECQGLRS